MEIAFQSRTLRDACESAEKLAELYGHRVADSVKRRLADLRAASNLTDLAVGKLRTLEDGRQTMCLDLLGGYRIFFRSNHVKRRGALIRGDGLSAISRIKVIGISKDGI